MSSTHICLTTAAAVAIGSLAAVAVPEPAAAAYSTPIPAGTQLTVQDQTDVPSARFIQLASLTVTTSTANQVRRLRGYLPVRHSRSGVEPLPDRFFTHANVSCAGAAVPAGTFSGTNVLLNGAVTHAPRMIVTFPTARTYTCTLNYKITTSRVYNDGTDNMMVPSDGYVAVSDPMPSWAKQCYWPNNLGSAPDCDVIDPSQEIASKKIAAGSTVVRTPIRASIPHGTTAYVYADASLTTCGGTGGADYALCGTDGGSWLDSTVVSNLKVNPIGTTRTECWPTIGTSPSYDDYQRLDIAVKTHHATLYHVLRITTTTNSTCPSTYRLTNELTAFSNMAPAVVHQNGTLLFLSP